MPRGGAIGLNPAERTVASLLKDAGYATGCIGKWHLGFQPEYLPTKQGFDSYYGIPYSNDMDATFKTRIDDNTSEAIARGVFGVPTVAPMGMTPPPKPLPSAMRSSIDWQ
mgnify:CR=1 FL=1